MSENQPGDADERSLTVLPSGHRVEICTEDQRGVIRVADSDGQEELRIELGPDGPVLRMRRARVVLESDADLDLRCRSFKVDAQESIALRSEGGCSLRAGHDVAVSGQAVEVTGRMGEVALEANDDLVLNGERVMLNCPTEEQNRARLQQVRDVQDLLQASFHGANSPRRLERSAPVEEEPAPAADEEPKGR